MATPQVQTRTISHTGSELGSSNITLENNQTSPQMETPIISFEGPDKFEKIAYNGDKHATRFIPRTEQTVTGSTGDDTVVSLNSDIQPVPGQNGVTETLSEQEFPAVVAADDSGNEVDITNVDYAANEVTLAQDPADGVDFHVYPIVTEGTIQFRGKNQFGQVEGALTEWATPLYRFSDFNQNQRGTEVNLDGAIEWTRNEELEVVIDSPHAIQWTHAQWPRGAYVSKFGQDVDIHL